MYPGPEPYATAIANAGDEPLYILRGGVCRDRDSILTTRPCGSPVTTSPVGISRNKCGDRGNKGGTDHAQDELFEFIDRQQ